MAGVKGIGVETCPPFADFFSEDDNRREEAVDDSDEVVGEVETDKET